MKSTSSFQFEEIQAFRFGYHPFKKPNLFVYLYFVDGLLIDTGQRRMQPSILSATHSLPIQQVFITHHHEDHTGNIDEICAKHGCEAFSSSLTREIMQKPPSLSCIQKVMYASRGANFNIKAINSDWLETPKYRFQLIAVPGHAADMVALYEPIKKWLFSADLFINTHIGFMLKDESIQQQIESIQRILTLDFDVLFCAHNPQLKDGKEKLKNKLQFLEQFMEQVSSWNQKGYSDMAIFKAMKLKENRFVKILSNGNLSKLNMVKSALRDLSSAS